MQPAHHVLSAVVLTLLSASSLASTVVSTSSASFLPRVAPGAYTENFDGLGNPPSGPVSFSGGGFSYTASAPSDIYLAGGFLGTSQINEVLTILFTSGNVTALGANFFVTNLADEFQAVSVTLTLSDGTVETFMPSSQSDSYRGFSSDLVITSLTMSAPGQSLYAGLDNLTIGTAVPEPASWALAGLALAGLFVTRRRAA